MLAQRYPDHQIAAQLNAEGIRTQTGKEWTHQRVMSIRKQHDIPTACPVDPTAQTVRGDGLLPVMVAAERLQVSPALVHVWIGQGALESEQRIRLSYRWVRLTEADIARLDGKHDWGQFPTVREVMQEQGVSREAVWDAVRSGRYIAYRHPAGARWEWRLEQVGEVTAVGAARQTNVDASLADAHPEE